MFSLESLQERIKSLETKANRLDVESKALDERLLTVRAQAEPFPSWLALELCALAVNEEPLVVDEENETVRLARQLGNAEYENVVYESLTGRFLFHQSSEYVSLEDRIAHVLENELDGSHRVMFVGAALLQMYVQANWSGPPVACLIDPSRYPLPYLSRENDMQGEEDALARLDLEARATAAATGKDKTMSDLDPFPRLHAKVASEMEINGESLAEIARGTHFLQVSRVLLEAVSSYVKNAPLTIGWWQGRCATVYQESLQSRDVAYDLLQECESSFKSCWDRLTIKRSNDIIPVSPTVLSMFLLERGVAAHKFKEVAKAKQLFNLALSTLELSVELSGALGKRTKFQLEEKAQLVLLASSQRTKPPEKPTEQSIEPSKEGEAAGFGSRVEAGHVKVRIEEVDGETPLHEKIQITPSDSVEFETKRRGHLSLIDQVTILNLCIDVKNSYAMERLTAEEMLAYCERVAENPDNWTVHGCALLIKSKLEFERWKTKERSVLQMQMLVDQQTNRLTPLQYRQKDITEDSASPLERLLYLHSLVWPPVWRLKRGLADRYKEIGVMGSALNLYQELRMWDDAVSCLVQMDKRHRAESLIRERLAVRETPNLLVTLGELLNDDSLLEKAWTISNRRYARAKRLLGAHAYEKGDFAKAKEHLHQALEVNAQFPWAWFRLGAAALRTEDWLLAKKAYARVVSLEPEDPEAWANLSACLARLGDDVAAFRAIEEATKYGFGNARIWDSFLTLALKVKNMDSALLGVDTLIDLDGKKTSAPRVDVRALLPLTQHAIEEPSFRSRYEQLIAKIKAKCQSQADVWALVSEYFAATNRKEDRRDALYRRCRALVVDPNWTKDFTSISRLVSTTLALCNTCLEEDVKVRREAALFVKGLLDKLGDLKDVKMEDDEKREAMLEKLERLRGLLGSPSFSIH